MNEAEPNNFNAEIFNEDIRMKIENDRLWNN